MGLINPRQIFNEFRVYYSPGNDSTPGNSSLLYHIIGQWEAGNLSKHQFK